MQQAQRAELNHALEYAVHRANELDQPLLVAFGLMDDYPEANRRHYHFMLQGLADVAAALEQRNIRFVVQRGHPDDVALRLAQHASLVVCDRGYLRHQREWRDRVAQEAGCAVVQVESDVVVPVELVSDKPENAARTIRPKITRHLERFLVALPRGDAHDDLLGTRRDRRGPLGRGCAARPARPRRRGSRRAAVHGRDQRGQAGAPRLPRRPLRRLRRAPQPAADDRRVAHEQVPALRPALAGLHRPGGLARRHRARTATTSSRS